MLFFSGGLPIPVKGTDLDSIANPEILVRVTCKGEDDLLAVKKEVRFSLQIMITFYTK